MPRDADIRYAIRVQDSALKELTRNIRTLNKELDASERSGGAAGTASTRLFDGSAKSAKAAQVSLLGYGGSLKQIAKTAGAVGLAVSAIDIGVSVSRDSIAAASSLNEEVSKSKVVFGASADEILAWSKTTADAFGISQRAALQASGSYGTMLTPLGIVPDKAADMSRAMVELAADMASFNNESPEEMLDRIRSGLAGEVEPLRRFGANLSEARVQAFAFSQGIAEAGTKLSEQQKTLARYGLLLEDTRSAQGDVARTSGSLANQQRRLRANFEELEANLGGVMIPVLTDLAKAGNLAFDGLDKLASLKGKLDFLPDVGLPDWLKSGISVAPFSPLLAGALAVKEALGGSADEADRLTSSIKSNAASSAMETQLRARIGSALDDVHEKALDTFDRETEALIDANERVTDDLLRSFDKTTEEMLDRMRVVVKVGERQFEIGRGQLTPAERELEALEKLEAKRRNRRELRDAREELGQALLIGDPTAIRDAKREVQDAETERRKLQLTRRAKTERELANEALAAEEEQLQESRDLLRRDLERRQQLRRDALADQRDALRKSLDTELAAQKKAFAESKTTAAGAQKEILATLQEFGADYKGVGEELATKFLAGFTKGMKMLKLELRLDPAPGETTGQRGKRGAASGGIAGQLGMKGASDTVPAWLTPGEMILTSGDQRQLARMLGSENVGWPLLSKIRMGFAEGGVVDENLLRMLLERFSANLSQDAVKRGTGLADPTLLAGGLSKAERKALSPVHLQSMVKRSVGAETYLGMDRDTKLELLNRLASRQAHPVRSGLISVGSGGGYRPGSNFRDDSPGNGRMGGQPGTSFAFGDINFSAAGPRELDTWALAQKIRSELIRLEDRNGGKRKRGRNRGRGAI